ncbi:SCAN domain-containing protein 3 [Frankliniella fusca]|uniref:SCAN domain-containing protein 3 n=1 Tax=Frankliniella fusca TaxID=407009 RepID=A0AAE1HEI3_9NEOP|nr:SCAN domain-containing protein 3 [Frankliniella fusca]
MQRKPAGRPAVIPDPLESPDPAAADFQTSSMPELIPIETPEKEQKTSEEEVNLSEFVLDLPDPYFDLTCTYRETCVSCGSPVHYGCTTSGICAMCRRASTIGQHQRDARQGLLRQATRMTRNTERNFPGPSVGDTVAVPTADPDRARGDSRNVMAVVTEVLDNGLYRVGNEHGLLGRALSRNQFTVSKHRFLDVENVQRDKELGYRTFFPKLFFEGYFVLIFSGPKI